MGLPCPCLCQAGRENCVDSEDKVDEAIARKDIYVPSSPEKNHSSALFFHLGIYNSIFILTDQAFEIYNPSTRQLLRFMGISPACNSFEV